VQQRMDFMTVAGICLGVFLVLGSIAMQGSMMIFWSISALMITVGGSFAALLINFQFSQISMVFRVTKNAFFAEIMNIGEVITLFTGLSQKARREGLLAMEDDLSEMDDSFIVNGLQMVIDGVDPELIREILQTEVTATEMRHKMGQDVFRAWGSLAPAFGMIGTLIGLIQMLTNLDDPSKIGPGMAVALLTTFYGALLSNLLFIPIAGKLAIRSEAEIGLKDAIIQGILSIQAGTNPRILQEKMKAFASPREREEMEQRKNAEKAIDNEEVVAENA